MKTSSLENTTPSSFARMDERGSDVDMSLIEECLRLTPAQRVERHYHARIFAEKLRRAGEMFYGSPHPDPEAA